MMAKARWWGPLGVLAVACFVVAALLLQQPAQPASAGGPTRVLDVDSFSDEPDYALNSVCSAGQHSGGPCTLRAAVMESRSFVQMGTNVVIKLPPGTYALTQVGPDPGDPQENEKVGDLDLWGLSAPRQTTVTIESAGPGPAIIDARGIDRALEIGWYHNVILRNLEIRNGRTAGTKANEYGGGIHAEGANLRLEDVRLINNEARASAIGYGGGLRILNGNLIMERCELRGNRARIGSALYTEDLSFEQEHYAAIHQSAIHDNESVNPLGGAAIYAESRLFLVNSTVAGNRGSAGENAAVHAQARAWIHNSTLQTAGAGWNLDCWNKPCEVRNSALTATLGAGGYALNCRAVGHGASVVSAGGNVFDDSTCNPDPGLNDIEIMSDIWGLHPFTGLYYLPNKDSPVVNLLAGPCTGFRFFEGANMVEGVITVDQRGAPRSDGSCDAGAIEVGRVWSYLPLTAR